MANEFQLLEKRVGQIESQNRCLRWLTVTLAAIALVSAAWGQSEKELTMKAQKFELRDDKGHLRAELAVLSGEPVLRLFGSDGNVQSLLSGSSFEIFDGEGGEDFLASFHREGLIFENSKDKLFVSISAHDKDQMGKLRLNDYRTGTYVVIGAQDLARLKAKSQ